MFNISNALYLNLSSSVSSYLYLGGLLSHIYGGYYNYFFNCSIRPKVNTSSMGSGYVYGA